MDPYELCFEFYELNKNKNLDGLLNLQILTIREKSEYDEKIHKNIRIPAVIGIDDSVSMENIKLPSFKKNADLQEKKIFFSRLSKEGFNYLQNKYGFSTDSSILFNFYVEEINSIYSRYNQIKVPNSLPYTNIEVNGLRNYIKFTLYRNEEMRIQYRCYYVKDTLFSNDRLKEYFKTLPKFDDHWYYDINW